MDHLSSVISRHVPPGERILLAVRPSPMYVPLTSLGSTVLVIAASIGVWKLLEYFATTVGRGDTQLYANLHALGSVAVGAGAAFIVLRWGWQFLEWRSRFYALTDRRVLRIAGVLRQRTLDAPLRNVQHLTVYRSIRERISGLGTIGINTSGTAFTEMYWVMVPRPNEILSAMRAATDAAAPKMNGPKSSSAGLFDLLGGGPAGEALAAAASDAAANLADVDRPIVIGLVGGIGAGKSAVANEFENLGATVIDSDKEARAVLLRPEVRDELVAWWGSGILNTGGAVDRKKVAEIVFHDPEARARLESLVHPLVKRSRSEIVKRAGDLGSRVVVVDAPLLYEAGVDRECDFVVFVDAPYDQRLARVSLRGWDASELNRREKAQLPLEEKRRRADDTLVNDGRREDLSARVADLLSIIQSKTGSKTGSGGAVSAGPRV